MTNSTSIPKTSDRLSGYERVKVDTGQTSFFEGREFRSFKELNIAASATYVIKAVVPTDLILTQIRLDVDNGFLRMGTYVGGTPGGSFSEALPIFARNNMSIGPSRRYGPTPGAIVTAGGTHTDGIELDVLRVRAAAQNVSASTVGVSAGDERGIAAGTYYFRLLNLDANSIVTGMLHFSWEERVTPPASPYA